MKKLFSIALFLIFNACLLVGFVAGLAVGEENQSPSPFPPNTASAAPTPTRMDGTRLGQQNILFIAVDSLEATSPHLKGIWLAMFIPPDPRLTLVPLYPAGLENGAAQDAFLVSIFQLGADRKPLTSFFSALQANDLWWTNYIILDDQGLAHSIDVLGGIDIGGRKLDGKSLVAAMPAAWDDPASASQAQISLASAICRQGIQGSSQHLVQQFLPLIPNHLVTDLPVENLSAAIRTGLEVNLQLSCKFPTVNE
jgi:hypothetical protein